MTPIFTDQIDQKFGLLLKPPLSQIQFFIEKMTNLLLKMTLIVQKSPYPFKYNNSWAIKLRIFHISNLQNQSHILIGFQSTAIKKFDVRVSLDKNKNHNKKQRKKVISWLACRKFRNASNIRDSSFHKFHILQYFLYSST